MTRNRHRVDHRNEFLGSARFLRLLRSTLGWADEDGRREVMEKRRKQWRRKAKPAAEELVSPRVAKYWHQRYSLFSRYDAGIAMDEEGWFSVTPEEVAARHAELCGRVGGGGGAVVVDGFSGVGGNAIQFAKRGCYVVAVEIDARKVEFARHNARIYGVEGNIDFVVGDFLRLAPSLKGDVVFLSPPWGGPDYRTIGNFTLDFLKPEDGYSIFQLAQRISPNIIMFLPRNVDLNQVEELSWLSSPPLELEVLTATSFSQEACRQRLQQYHPINL